jgi:hypothetical protein
VGRKKKRNVYTVNREMFLEWRSPRFGRANPERMTNPVWEWLVRSKLSAYEVNKAYNGPSALAAGPGWCFSRFGQSTTPLADGRTVLIAGEHEDHYDPDFYIYNDVVVLEPDGGVSIYGYPSQVFQPTDFHSATLEGDRIVLIGNLGYLNARGTETPISILNLKNMSISSTAGRGTSPGWIHGHEAALSKDGRKIRVRSGKRWTDSENPLVENIDDWELSLGDWSWTRLTRRRWPRWVVRRADGRCHHLFQITCAWWTSQHGPKSDLPRELEALTSELGAVPELAAVDPLFRPSIPHDVLPEDEEHYDVRRIRVDGVIVRYVESPADIQVTVEGELPAGAIAVLKSELASGLEVLENAPCIIETIDEE